MAGRGPRAQPAPAERIAAIYERFSEVEAPGRSPLYARLTRAIAHDAWMLEFLAQMPEPKWQPNLLLGAVRYLYGTPETAAGFIDLVRTSGDEIAAEMAVRSTQTNEPARCATLLPALAQLPQPLALLEVGASAGLCLLPDYYAFDYGQRQIEPSVSIRVKPPVFCCQVDAATPLPEQNVEVAWRGGLDLHPIDLSDDSEVGWLEALIWPGQEYRLPRLRAACEVARSDPPRVVVGDLRTDLRSLAAQAPSNATLVVFHTAVLAYLPEAEERAAFARAVAELDAVWIANERPAYIPGLADDLSHEGPNAQAFLLCRDGTPTAWTDPHGIGSPGAPHDMSLPAISKHLKVLERAGLISRRRDAQWRPCHLVTEPLRHATTWLERYRQFWDRADADRTFDAPRQLAWDAGAVTVTLSERDGKTLLVQRFVGTISQEMFPLMEQETNEQLDKLAALLA